MQFSVPKSLFITISLALIGLLVACGGQDRSSPPSHSLSPMSGPPSNAVQQFSGVRDAYTIQKNSSGYLVTEVAGSGAAVQVSAQSTLRFSNVSVNLLMAEKVKQISPKDLNSIIELYIAFFNRVPDADGLCYWIDQFNAGMSLDQMSESFYQAAILFSKETGYSATMSDAAFVKIIYENVLGRSGHTAPPAEDVAYWVGELTSGRSSKGRLISTMLNAAHTFAGDARWGWVPRFLDNKITVATLFSVEQGLNYLSPEDSIVQGMKIVLMVTEGDISDAVKLIPMADVAFNLRGQLPVSASLMGGAIQKGALNLRFDTTTFAGSVPWADGDGIAARFYGPMGIESDGAHVYIADQRNNAIRKVDIATGLVTTLAGAGGRDFSGPSGLVQIGGDLYVSDRYSVRKVSIATGKLSTVAGSARDGTGTDAKFKGLAGIATDGTNLFVVDQYAHTIRQIVIATGAVTTLAGTAGINGSGDGIGTAASFDYLTGICTDGLNLYVADSGNHSIRKIELATSRVTTLAGKAGKSGASDGIGEKASFKSPSGVSYNSGKLYVSDWLNQNIRQIDLATAEVTTLAGTGLKGYKDGFAASFAEPRGLVSDGISLYVADTGNNVIRKIALATAETSTLAGREPYAEGVRAAASFTSPQGITTDGTNLYVADDSNHNIRKIVIATGAVSIFSGARSSGDGLTPKIYYASMLTTDGKHLFVVDQHSILKIVIATGEKSTLAGSRSVGGSGDGIGSSARFQYPGGITTDGNYLYVAEPFNHTIRMVEIETGKVTTLAGKISVKTAIDGVGDNAGFGFPTGITTDGSNLYVVDGVTIRKIVIATGQVTTFVGYSSIVEGIDNLAQLGMLNEITCDGKNLYVTSARNVILKIEIATTKAKIIVGQYHYFDGYRDGVGTNAIFYAPKGITTDGRSLFVVDLANAVIRKID